MPLKEGWVVQVDHDGFCACVPVSDVRVTLRYCHYHQAWHGSVAQVTQDGGPPYYVSRVCMEFGPFDSEVDVRQWAECALERALSASGTPWEKRLEL